MRSVTQRLQQLRGRTPHELYLRASQMAFAWSERAALRLAKPHSAKADVAKADVAKADVAKADVANADVANAHVANADARSPSPIFKSGVFRQPFFAGLNDINATLRALRALVPNDEAEVAARANDIARGNVPLFGLGLVHLGDAPEWQRDPVAGLSAPMRHWSTIPYLDVSVVGDHKVIWEISRHQYFVTLGQAWRYSRDEKWPRLFVSLLQSWLNGNPPTVGMNWASSLEVSYRAISWLWAFQLMHDAPSVDANIKARAMASLQAHGRHLERYLSTYFSPNTHLTGEALGLFYLGTQCPELPKAAEWARTGASILESSLEKHVLPDGVYFEQATQYHRYTIEIYLHYLLLLRASGRTVPASVERALNALFDVLLHLTRGDGTMPLMGDDDGGRLVQLDGRQPHDVRALLAMGAVVLSRSDLAWLGRGDDAALGWLLGATAPNERNRLIVAPPAETAQAFPNGGLYTMRDGWGRDDGHAAIDAGPHGALSFGHSHADALSMEIAIGGKALFVDPGTFTYMGAERNAFRSTAAHNTVEIDGQSTSVPASAFRWQSVAHAYVTGWASEPEFAYFIGAHDAYAVWPSPLRHSRSVLQPASGLWMVRDLLTGSGPHQAVLRWHSAPGHEAALLHAGPGESVLQISEGKMARAILATFGGPDGNMRIESGWVSQQFGHKAPAPVCAWRESLNGNAVLASIVIDVAKLEYSAAATDDYRQRVRGAQGFVILSNKDAAVRELLLVMIGNGQVMTFNNLEIEADMVCVRLDARSERPLGLTAAGVTFARMDGITFVPTSAVPRWMVVSNSNAGANDAWHVRSGAITLPGVPSVATVSDPVLTLTNA